jgi:RND family efflux transporter MFP subunit
MQNGIKLKVLLLFLLLSALLMCSKKRSGTHPAAFDIDSTAVCLARFYDTYTGYGKIEPTRSTDLVAQFDGNIHFMIKEDSHYYPDEVIFRLEGDAIGLQRQELSSTLEIARTNLQFIQERMDRSRTLEERDLVSTEAWQDILKEYQNADQTFRQAQSASDYFGKMTCYKAPFNGIVSDLEINQGDYIEKGRYLARFNAIPEAKLTGQIYEKPIPFIPDSVIHVTIQDSLDITGRLTYIEKAINTETGGRTFWIVLDTLPRSLELGSFVKFSLRYAPCQAPAVPVDALIMDRMQFYVVVIRNGIFENQRVTLGRENGNFREIVDGPPVGIRIVTKGAFEVFYSHLKNTMNVED